MNALAHQSSNGKTYYLHASRRQHAAIFYFALKITSDAVSELPPGKVIVECASGFPILRNEA